MVTRDVLLQGLLIVYRAISNSPIPILSCVLLEANNEELIILAGGPGYRVQHRIRSNGEYLDVRVAGKICLPAHYLVDIIKRLDPSPLIIQSDSEGPVVIRNSTSLVRLSGLPAEEYPYIFFSPPSTLPPLRFTADQFAGLIKQVAFAASDRETRPLLAGVLLQLSDEGFRITATDSVKFASCLVIPDPLAGSTPFFQCVLSASSLAEAAKIILSVNVDTQGWFDGSVVYLQAGQTLMVLSSLEGIYPSIQGIVPSDFTYQVQLNRIPLLNIMERLKVLADNHIVRIMCSDSDLSFYLCSDRIGIGEIMEHVTGERAQGTPVQVAFNGTYMMDILRSIPTPQIWIRLSGTSKPIVISPIPEGLQAPVQAAYVLTPVRVREC